MRGQIIARTQQARKSPDRGATTTAKGPRRGLGEGERPDPLRQICDNRPDGYFGCASRSIREITETASRITSTVVMTTTRSIVTRSQLPAS